MTERTERNILAVLALLALALAGAALVQNRHLNRERAALLAERDALRKTIAQPLREGTGHATPAPSPTHQ